MCAGCFTHLLADSRLRDSQATCPNCRVEINRNNASRNLAVEKAVSELPSECQVSTFATVAIPKVNIRQHFKVNQSRYELLRDLYNFTMINHIFLSLSLSFLIHYSFNNYVWKTVLQSRISTFNSWYTRTKWMRRTSNGMQIFNNWMSMVRSVARIKRTRSTMCSSEKWVELNWTEICS